MAQPARLTSGLLARKGQALPTGGFAMPSWIWCRAPEPSRRPAPAQDDRVALTLRLDRARYTRLKILAARRARSGQELLLRALDAYLEACAVDCACLRSTGRRGEN